MVIIGLFFVIGIGVGVVAVVALSILRPDVGPPGGPDHPRNYGPPGPSGPAPDLNQDYWSQDYWQDGEPSGTGTNTHWRSYERE